MRTDIFSALKGHSPDAPSVGHQRSRFSGQAKKRVSADIMRDQKCVTRSSKKLPLQGFFRCKSNRMQHQVQTVGMVANLPKKLRYLRVTCYIAGIERSI